MHSIDGRQGTLASTFYPSTLNTGLPGDVHLDCSENWASTGSGSQIDLLEILVHETGHALGLAHETNNDAIMNPFYAGRYNGLGTAYLTQDDINGICQIYGQGAGSVSPLSNGGCGNCVGDCATSASHSPA